MTDTKDLIREIQEHTAAHGGENTAAHLLVQAAMALQRQADELAAIGAGGVSGPLLGGTLRTQSQPVGDEREAFEAHWRNSNGYEPLTWDAMCKRQGVPVPEGCEGRYFYREPRLAWGAWQARAAIAAPQHAAPAGGWIDDAGRIKWLEWRVRDLEAQRDAALAAPQPGYVLVPVEPTEAMVSAGYDAFGVNDCYSSMLAAAPKAPQQAAPAVASKAVLAAIRAANMQLVRTGEDTFMLVTLKQAAPQQDVQEPNNFGAPASCDSPALCSVSRICAGQFGTKRLCVPAIWTAQPAPSGDAWTPVAERLPEPQTPVLLDIGKKYPVRAAWVPKGTLPVGLESDTGFGEYDEGKDEYFCPEGWYEWNQHEECHWAVSEKPLAWMALPKLDAARKEGNKP